MKYLSSAFVSAALLVSAVPSRADVKLFDGRNPVTYSLPADAERPVAQVAAGMLDEDLAAVTGMTPVRSSWDDARIRVCNLASASPQQVRQLVKAGIPVRELRGRKDGFCLKAHGGRLYVAGADDRGTAYGLLEVSRLAGVSPWVWWNDVNPPRRELLSVPDRFFTLQSPSVEYRGIFLNDEDWSLQPWSWMTFEPGNPPGMIGARTYKEIFKLLMRLRANAIWPGMHGITVPFYLVPGAKETADSCGIAIGTSHCEPLMRNNVGEWKVAERGEYNYVTNRLAVLDYWAARLQEVGGFENMYTIGMRGVHDGDMEGVTTMEEKVSALQRVLDDQRRLLARYVDSAVTSVPQVFVPYKEVLDIMDNGLVVPDDVTLMWCDDNYGYMTRLGDQAQQRRSGGAGVYYHLSYWGRPHDYMWLGSTQPGLVYSEMKSAYDHNARKVWIVNVHDMKTASYGMELFLDMAWNIGSVTPGGVGDHLRAWLCRDFGPEIGEELYPVMREYYRLCGIRRPDHMGWTQVELSDRKAYPRGRSHVVDTEFSFRDFGNEADRYLAQYDAIVSRAAEIGRKVPARLRDAFFAQITYPVNGAAAMAAKMLEAQRARSYAYGQCDGSLWERDSLMLSACARSENAYLRIRRLTAFYNDSLAAGKWRHSMCMNPRDLCVFNPPVLPVGLTEEERAYWGALPFSREVTEPQGTFVALNACDWKRASFTPEPVDMLGHSMRALPVPAGAYVEYEFDLPSDGPLLVTAALLPTQPADTGDIRVSISLDGGEPQTVSYREAGRTDIWKENVLRNQARVRTLHSPGSSSALADILPAGRHTLRIAALDPHVILDQILVDTAPSRRFYVIPAPPVAP